MAITGAPAPSSKAVVKTPRSILRSVFGHEEFRPGQEEIINAVLSGRDTALVMPTGGGKSLCFQIPALCSEGTTLVVSPLIALMKDQVDALQSSGIQSTFINSSISDEEREVRTEGMKAGLYGLVYIAPERLDGPSFLQALQATNVTILAVDEAHAISQWGHDFRPAYRKISRVFSALTNRPTVIALTATATPVVQDDVCSQLGMVDPLRVVTGFDRPNLHQRVEYLSSEFSKSATVLHLAEKMLSQAEAGKRSTVPPAIWYAGTRNNTTALSKTLNELSGKRQFGNLCAAYHAGMKDADREKVQNRFMSGEYPWVVATNAFGMGIDKSNIRYVVHATLPGSVEAYYQEIGRAGRDGKDSECVLAYSDQDVGIQQYFIDIMNPEEYVFRKAFAMLVIMGEEQQGRAFKMTYSDFYRETESRYGKRWAREGAVSTCLTVLKGKGAFRAPKRGYMDIPARRIQEVGLDGLGIDFKDLQEKRNRDEEKLRSMLAYTKAKDLKKAIRVYFGEESE